MHLKLADIPEEIIEEYKLCEIVTDNGYVYCKIRKGMYGVPQAGLIAQELLEQRLSKVGYRQSKIIPGLWTHKTRKTCFTLVFDNFAIKFTKIEDAKHLIEALEKDYKITIDWGVTKYIGLTIDWEGLQQGTSTCAHARLLRQSIPEIQTCCTKQETTLTPSPHHPPIWNQDPICRVPG